MYIPLTAPWLLPQAFSWYSNWPTLCPPKSSIADLLGGSPSGPLLAGSEQLPGESRALGRSLGVQENHRTILQLHMRSTARSIHVLNDKNISRVLVHVITQDAH